MEKKEWVTEDYREHKTLKNKTLRVARICFKEDNKRCIEISKHGNRCAFDIEMVPLIIFTLLRITPEETIRDKVIREELKKLRKAVMRY